MSEAIGTLGSFDYLPPRLPTPSMAEDQILTVAEAAALLKLHPETIRRAIRTGELPATKFGYRTVRINRSDLDKWVKSKGYVPTPEPEDEEPEDKEQ